MIQSRANNQFLLSLQEVAHKKAKNMQTMPKPEEYSERSKSSQRDAENAATKKNLTKQNRTVMSVMRNCFEVANKALICSDITNTAFIVCFGQIHVQSVIIFYGKPPLWSNCQHCNTEFSQSRGISWLTPLWLFV